MERTVEGIIAIALIKKLASQHADKFIEVANAFQLQIQVSTMTDENGLDQHEIVAHDWKTADSDFYVMLEYTDDTFSVQIDDMSFNLSCEHLTSVNVNKIVAFMASF